MLKLMQQLASVRLWVGISLLTFGLGMASCQKNVDVKPVLPEPDYRVSVSADSTNDDPPEKPVKPGGY